MPDGVDVVMDMVGGEPFREALKVASWGAQILFIGFATGDIPKVSHSRSDRLCSQGGCGLLGKKVLSSVWYASIATMAGMEAVHSTPC